MYHPDEVARRKKNRLKRKQFYSAGVNDLWVKDQHDKWKRFNLYYHVGLEPYSGFILWFKVWWTNRNPRLVCSYYLNAIEAVGGERFSPHVHPCRI